MKSNYLKIKKKKIKFFLKNQNQKKLKKMKKFSEEELSKLKKLTDEIFVISNNPQLPVVQKMKKIDCCVMNTGLRKINMDYFFCKTCDKEHKFPICKQCAEKCHKGHLIPDYVQGSDDHPAICMCGFKCHNMGKKEKPDCIWFYPFNPLACLSISSTTIS